MNLEPICPQHGPQEHFLRTSADVALYGGAVGGGKTFALLLEACRYVHIPGMTAVIFRRTCPQVRQEGGLWDTSLRLFPRFNGIPRLNDLEWSFPSGASVKFAHMQYEQDKYTWDGSQIAFLGFDELTHFTASQFWYLLSRNRSTCGVLPYVRATCNPDAGSWVREFVDGWIDPQGQADPDKSGMVRHCCRADDGGLVWRSEPFEDQGNQSLSVTFIPARLEDNPALTELNPRYRDTLAVLSEEERKRLLEGNWDVRPDRIGRILKAYDPMVHLLTPDRVEHIDPMANHLELWEGWDFGTGAMSATAVVWALYDRPADKLYVWDWLVDYEQPADWWSVHVQSRRFKPIHAALGDPAGAQRESDQQHWFSRLRERGVSLSPSVNRPRETIFLHRWALRESRIVLHPNMAQRVACGPLLQGSRRQRKSLSDAYFEYHWALPDGVDPASAGARPSASQPLKNWASHPMDALGYIVRTIWGHVAKGVRTL